MESNKISEILHEPTTFHLRNRLFMLIPVGIVVGILFPLRRHSNKM